MKSITYEVTVMEIYHGSKLPMRAVGKHQCRILEFAEKYPGWHSINARCKSSLRATKRLADRGYLTLDPVTMQFRINYPPGVFQ